MPKGIPQNGINKGRFKKGFVPKNTGIRQHTKCKRCGEQIRTFPSRPRIFCNHTCATRDRWETGELQQRKKVEPWNKGTKGIMKENSGSFKYQGKEKQIKGKSESYWRQEARHKMRLNNNDERIVHHIDEDITNNNIYNLKIMERGEHVAYHNKKRIIKNPELKYFGKNKHLRGGQN